MVEGHDAPDLGLGELQAFGDLRDGLLGDMAGPILNIPDDVEEP
jgi:hypothetical protein